MSSSEPDRDASLTYTGLRCKVTDCQFVCLKHREMKSHHTDGHEGIGHDSPCSVREKDGRLEIIMDIDLTSDSLVKNLKNFTKSTSDEHQLDNGASPLSSQSSIHSIGPLSQSSNISPCDTPPSSPPNLPSLEKLDQALTTQDDEPVRVDMSKLDPDFLLPKCLSLARAVPPRECRKCWHNHQRSGSQHYTFKCPTKILRDSACKAFKASARFPSSKICWYCFSPFDPPFSHPSGGRSTDCQFPDALKEFCYIIWEDEQTRSEVFNYLGGKFNPALVSLLVLRWSYYSDICSQRQ
ncbi:hypothetical protein FPV67DRAFT_1454474 [Lyophyllum atratum]|nr:hypothetical protein FPV67DRAFT_1454474 [Lyophyllum atratum]